MIEKTILIVDDDDGLRDNLEDILKDEGYVPYPTSCISEALRIAEEKKPNAALLDLKLPDGSGTDLLAQFRKNIPDCVCIMMTAFADMDSALFALEQGAFQYLQKPVRPMELLNSFQRAFETIQLREEKKRTERELRQSERTIRSLLDAFPSAAFLMDGQTHILATNKVFAESLGKDVEDILGQILGDLTGGEQLEKNVQKALEVISSKKTERYESEAAERYYDSIISPLFNDSGDVTRLAVFNIDITDRKRAELEKEKLEVQLAQSQKMEAIGTLAGGIAHDFNNILSPILGHAELLKEDLSVDNPIHTGIDEIIHASLRARDLVQQILTFSRQTEDELKPIKIHPVVKEAVKLIRSSFPKTIRIEQNIDSSCGSIIASPIHIHQIVMNLATNAFHAMEDTGGILRVTLKQVRIEMNQMEFIDFVPGAFACLTVSDTGIGIEKSIIDKVFDPYFTTKDKNKGTGLGLSVVHGIVKSYGGHIRISSNPGEGVEVHIYLPAMESRSLERETGATDTIQGGAERILLIDDEEAIVRMGQRMLERLGYTVTTRTGSIDALEAFKANPYHYDLIITDMSMPNMTGIRLSKEILAIRNDVPIVLCTGFSDQIDDEKIHALGISAYVMKPILKNEIAETIRKVLDTG